jgi:RNA polymerase sigma factor (sigma-70 family)
VSTAQDLPLDERAVPYGQPLLRLVPTEPLDFDDAVTRVRPRLHRYAVRRLGDVHEAEELVQEALLRAYTHREQLLTEDDLSAWTTVVTGRLVIDRLRVRGRSTSFADVPEGHRVSRDTADIVVAKDEARTALDALDAMPARQASLLWAREVEGHSYEQLCARFDMTEPAVRSVLTRARKALRKEYALRGGTLPVGGLAVLAPWIASLTRVDKLRRLVTRATAPAALGAVAITTLGGLILSPLGIGAVGGDTFTPSQAVVSSHAVPAAVTTTIASAAPSTPLSSPTVTGPATATPTAPAQDHRALLLPAQRACVTTQQGYAAGGLHSSCNQAAPRGGSTLFVKVPLPGHPIYQQYVAIQMNDIACQAVPTQPVLGCTETTQPGASK